MAIDPDSPLYPSIDPTLLPAVPGIQGPRGTTGPTGPTGPRGQNLTILGVKGSFQELTTTVSDPSIGDAYVVNGEVYVWVGFWENIGDIYGPTGPAGADGAVGPTGPEGDRGPIGPAGVTGPQGPAGARGVTGPRGATGPQGAAGPTGPQGIDGIQGDPGVPLNIIGTVATPAELPLQGLSLNDAYMVESDKDLYVYNGSTWVNKGRIIGLDGPTGPQGNPGFQGPTGPTGSVGPRGFDGPTGPTGPILAGDIYSIDTINDLEKIAFLLNADGATNVGELAWNSVDGTLEVKVDPDVTLQIGQEQHARVHNNTGATLTNGTVVYVSGSSDVHGHVTVAPYIADGSVEPSKVLGIVTHNIPDDEDGYVTVFGLIRGLNTSTYQAGALLYASATVAGTFVTSPPASPGYSVPVAVVTETDATNGIIFAKAGGGGGASRADQITYNNDASTIEATNVKGALDELDLKKANVSDLSSNIALYATDTASDVSGYFTLVSSLDDPNFDTVAVDIPTGPLTGTGVLVASLVADANLFTGNPGPINVSTIGNIRKTVGNTNSYANFYFEVYRRNSIGAETLVGTSDTTDIVNPDTNGTYQEFSSTSLVSFGAVEATDRVVLKFYANVVLGDNPEYDIQFGGANPVRTLLPVPVSVIPNADASGILTDTTNFNNLLSAADTTVQAALETLDDLDALPDQAGNNGRYLTTNGIVANWDDIAVSSISDVDLTGLAAGYALVYDDVSQTWKAQLQIGPTGPTGDTGPVGATWQGTWDVLTAYVVDDLVEYSGSTYIAVVDDTGTTPGTDPAIWALVADAGQTGPTGPAGTLAVGTVTTGTPTDPATVTNSGTSTAAVFDFTIPQGVTGPAGADSIVPGPTGPQGFPGPTGPTGPESTFLAGNSQPVAPAGTSFEEGTAWFNTDTAKTYVYYNGSFVEISGNVGPQGPRGPQGSFSLSQAWWLGV